MELATFYRFEKAQPYTLYPLKGNTRIGWIKIKANYGMSGNLSYRRLASGVNNSDIHWLVATAPKTYLYHVFQVYPEIKLCQPIDTCPY